MNFVSLANPAEKATFTEALMRGVPTDSSSLYVPETIPQLSDEQIEVISDGNPFEIGRHMLAPYVEGDISEDDLATIVEEASAFETPLVEVGNRYVLELTHGPTMAFKDVAAAYLGSFLSYTYQQTGEPAVVVVATSGDTGGAIAEGMADREGVQVVMAYPKDRVSQLQQDQLRRVADNVHPVEVEGNFVDCLKLTLDALDNTELKERFSLTSANSISVGRLLPQTTYYAGLLQHFKDGFDGRVVVPSGNLGNLTAGLIAARMGVPLPNFVAGNNENDYLHRLLRYGLHVEKDFVPTVSNAMDVHVPKNAPRIEKWLFGGDVEALRDEVSARKVSDLRTAKLIRRVYGEEGYLMDPHTAVAWGASRPGDIIISTAAPQKFAQEIQAITGIHVDDTEQRAELARREERYTTIGNNPEEFLAVFDDLDSQA